MKTNILLIASLFSVAAMTSCGNSGEKTPANDSVVTTLTEVTTEVEEIAPAANADSTTAETAGDIVIELKGGQALPDNGKPNVLDFNAIWCGPCKNFAPIFHKVAGKYADKANFLSVDVDSCKALAEQYNVANIPTVAIVYPASASKEAVVKVGQMPEKDFVKFLNENL